MEDLTKRFMPHEVGISQANQMCEIRSAALYLAKVIQSNTPPSREQSLALTNVEQAMFWANAAIAREPQED